MGQVGPLVMVLAPGVVEGTVDGDTADRKSGVGSRVKGESGGQECGAG